MKKNKEPELSGLFGRGGVVPPSAEPKPSAADFISDEGRERLDALAKASASIARDSGKLAVAAAGQGAKLAGEHAKLFAGKAVVWFAKARTPDVPARNYTLTLAVLFLIVSMADMSALWWLRGMNAPVAPALAVSVPVSHSAVSVPAPALQPVLSPITPVAVAPTPIVPVPAPAASVFAQPIPAPAPAVIVPPPVVPLTPAPVVVSPTPITAPTVPVPAVAPTPSPRARVQQIPAPALTPAPVVEPTDLNKANADLDAWAKQHTH